MVLLLPRVGAERLVEKAEPQWAGGLAGRGRCHARQQCDAVGRIGRQTVAGRQVYRAAGRAETHNYIFDEDWLGRFLAACCICDPEERTTFTPTALLFEAWR